MHVRHLSCRNYRGLAALDIRLPLDTTVMVGENQWGRTSLFRAVETILGPLPDASEGFGEQHRTRGSIGPITISVDVGESFAGELTADSVLGPLCCNLFGKAVVRLRFTAIANGPKSELLDATGAVMRLDSARAEHAHRYLRERMPAIRMTLWAPSPSEASDSPILPALAIADDAVRSAGRDGAPTREALMASAESARAALVASRLADTASTDVASELRALMSGWRDGGSARPSVDRVCALLIAANALLRAQASTTASGVRPILLIEDPEAHLHPTMLANVWSLLESAPAQRLVTTNSSDFVATVDLRSIRRMVRRGGRTIVFGIKSKDLAESDLRRLSYHVSTLRGGALFARSWILVEGETEFWTLPGAARLLGHDLDAEGVRVVEFAQAGLESVLRLADCLGMPCQVLVDGDAAGRGYAEIVERFGAHDRVQLTVLPAPSIERYFWDHGLAAAMVAAAYGSDSGRHRPPQRVIDDAIRRHTKPGLARRMLEEMGRDPNHQIPSALKRVVERAVEMARRSLSP